MAPLLSEEYYEQSAAEALDGSAIYLFARPALARMSTTTTTRPSSMSDNFRETMRALASGVVLVTTEVGGRPWGVTVTSCCSLSVDPPRILVSLMRHTATCQAIETGAMFGVDLLGDAHKRIAQFGAARGVAKFLDDPMVVARGSGTATPMVEGALSHVDCELDEIFDGGDHAIVLGRVIDVVAAHPNSSGSPLLYFDGGYHPLGGPL
jgi:flavin reductase ActVB